MAEAVGRGRPAAHRSPVRADRPPRRDAHGASNTFRSMPRCSRRARCRSAAGYPVDFIAATTQADGRGVTCCSLSQVRVRLAGRQLLLDLAVGDMRLLDGIGPEHPAGKLARFCGSLRGHHNRRPSPGSPCDGNDVASRAQSVAVQGGTDNRPSVKAMAAGPSQGSIKRRGDS